MSRTIREIAELDLAHTLARAALLEAEIRHDDAKPAERPETLCQEIWARQAEFEAWNRLCKAQRAAGMRR